MLRSIAANSSPAAASDRPDAEEATENANAGSKPRIERRVKANESNWLIPCSLLHLVAAHVLVVEAFEPAAQLFGCWPFGRAGGVQLGGLHHLLGNVDWAVSAKR